MRRLDLTDYNVPLRNDEGIAKFKDAECECGQDLTQAEPINVKVKGNKDVTGSCPSCEKLYDLIVPEYLDIPYHVRDSMVEIALSRQLQLGGRELLERDDLAKKILAATDGEILLEEVEWDKLVVSADRVKGLARPDVEMIRRIYNAEEVEVEAKRNSEGGEKDEIQGRKM